MKKKILIYTDVGFFAGCENVLENIVNFPDILNKYNVVYSFRNSEKYSSDLNKRGTINTNTLPIFLITPAMLLSKFSNKDKKNIFIVKVVIRTLEKLQIFNLINLTIQLLILNKEKPDILHINNGGYPGADSCRSMAIAAGLLKIKKTIFTINNMAVDSNGYIDRLIDRVLEKNVDFFTTSSKVASNQLSLARGVSKGKLRPIPNTILFDNISCNGGEILRREFNVKEDEFIIGSAGLLIDRKGYDILIHAVSRLSTQNKWRLFIFGEGRNRSKLESLIEKYKLHDFVCLPGHRENIFNYVCDFDVFVMPSIRNEDMPNAINEAMLMGKPIIGSITSGIPEQIDDGVNGFLVECSDIDGMSAALDKVINMPKQEVCELGLKSKEKYINLFSYEKSMNSYLDLYNN